MNKQLVVLITGTSKGLGKELVGIFLKYQPKATIYATSREAPQIAYQRWSPIDPNKRVKCKTLQICSEDSVKRLSEEILSDGVKIDILINNAGICRAEDNGKTIPDLQYSRSVMLTNVLGPIQLTKNLLFALSENGRVVNVSSKMGGLMLHPQITQLKFNDPNLMLGDIEEGVEDFINSVSKKDMSRWYSCAYGTSKMFLNAWSRFILQKQWLSKAQVAVCVTPGFCVTEMTKDMPQNPMSYSSYSGAMKIYQAALREDACSDVFYHRMRISDYILCGQGLPYDQSPLE